VVDVNNFQKSGELMNVLIQLIILFFVIIDPLASFAVFFASTSALNDHERRRIATFAILAAAGLSLLVLIFGEKLLELFSTDINEFKVAGGIILGILGIKMTLGIELTPQGSTKEKSTKAIAAIIATPLLTGPATITAIMISAKEYGMAMTGTALLVVLGFTASIFYLAKYVHKLFNENLVQIISTILGLVTLAWGVKFVADGIVVILAAA
jgi:multiple antibiotic resistance protein